MPDSIERAAGYGAPSAPAPMQIVPAEASVTQPNAQLGEAVPVDDEGRTLPGQGGAGAPPSAQAQAGGPTPDSVIAQLRSEFESREKNLIKGWNRSMQDLAEQKKELERQMAYLHGLQAGGAGQGQPGAKRGLWESLPEDVRSQYDTPEGRQALSTIDRLVEWKLQQTIPELDGKYASKDVGALAQQAQWEVRRQQLREEYAKLAPTYGPVFEQYGDELGRVVQANPGMSLAAAMHTLFPDQAQAALETSARQKVVQEYQQKQQAALLEGQGRPSGVPVDWSSNPETEDIPSMMRRLGVIR